jgi:NADPH-dependent 2,4-dienoyl-CoA reductase/sulfur reductase-like enzyme
LRGLERPTVIVGGGVIGMCCAYFLAKRGARVIVLERHEIWKRSVVRQCGMHCTRPSADRQAGPHSDLGTVDLFSKIVEIHEKQGWIRKLTAGDSSSHRFSV